MTGGMSGGHFVGFFLALLGLAVLVVVSSRPVVMQRLGKWRLQVSALAVVLLALLAIFGSGSRHIFFQTLVGPDNGILPRITQADVDLALEDTLRPEFVQYVARLESAPPVEDSERLVRVLTVRVGTTVDLLAEGYHLDPPPKIGQTWFFISYSDREYALLAMFRGDGGIQRMKMAEHMVSRVLPQAAAIGALRLAKTDDEKLAILHENPFVVPYAAEWIDAELGKLAANASPALATELAQKRSYVQQYAKHPSARDVPKGTRIDVP